MNNPIKYIDPDGQGPKNRIKYARNLIGTDYRRETETNLRVPNTKVALEYMDCAEFVCRVIATDKITNGVKHMSSSALRTYLSDKKKFIHSSTPQIGDIAVWDGHVGIVTGVGKNGKVRIIHARGNHKLAAENPTAEYPSVYRNSTFHGYYRPIVESPDNNLVTPSTTIAPILSNSINNNPIIDEKIYYGGELNEIPVYGKATQSIRELPIIQTEKIKTTNTNILKL